MCRPAAWPGRSSGRDGSLRGGEEKEWRIEKLSTRSKNLSKLWSLTVHTLLASFGLKVGDAVHDDVVQEEGLVVDLDVARQQAVEVAHVPARGEGLDQTGSDRFLLSCPKQNYLNIFDSLT